MKKMKKIFALLLSFVMIMGMAVTANAATTQSTTEDTSVFKLEATASGATVSYKALTVEGGKDANGKTWPTVTTYAYYLSMPENSDLSSVSVKITFEKGYKLFVAGKSIASKGSYSGTLDLSSTKTVELRDSKNNVYRSFQVAAGIAGKTVPTVYVRIDVYNAVKWLGTKGNVNATTSKAVSDLIEQITKKGYTVNADGQMATFVPVDGLATGSTAMDALKAACNKLNLKIAGSDYYVSGIGAGATMLSERATTPYSGWLYLDKPVNGTAFEMANYGASSYTLNGGEQFVWCFANGWDTDQFSYLNK